MAGQIVTGRAQLWTLWWSVTGQQSRAGEDARDSLVAGVADLEALIAGFETP